MFSTFAYTQNSKLEYKIIANHTERGNITVTKHIDDSGMVEFTAVSDSKFKLFITVNFSYKLNCVYKDGIFLFSSVSTFVNGSQHSSTTASKIDKTTYVLKNSGHEKRIFKPISYSGIKLYFEEPKNVTEVFSEFYNSFNPLQKIKNQVYQLTNTENGYISEYYYQNGILQKAIIHHEIMTFSLEKTTK